MKHARTKKGELKMARINLTEMLNHEKETQENRGRKFARNFYFKKGGRNNALVKFLLIAQKIFLYLLHTLFRKSQRVVSDSFKKLIAWERIAHFAIMQSTIQMEL